MSEPGAFRPPAPERGRTNPLARLGVLLWPLLALGLLMLFNAIFTDGFFAIRWGEGERAGNLYGSIIDVVNNAAPIALIAVGMTLVIATGGIDLSVGAVLAIAGAVAATLLANDVNWVLAVIAALGSGLLCGLVSGLLVAGAGVQPIIATLILMVAGRGVAQMVGQNVPVLDKHVAFNYIGGGYFLALPFAVTLVVLVYAVAIGVMRLTALGLFVESAGNNPVASRYAGVRVRPVIIVAYLVSGLCAALAGIVVTSDIKQADSINAGLYFELDAILAVVVGGTALVGGRFTLLGSLVGAVLIQMLNTTILTRGLAFEWGLVTKAVVVLVVCLLQSPDFRRRLSIKRNKPAIPSTSPAAPTSAS